MNKKICLDDNRFSGYIYNHGNKVAFNLFNVSRPNYTGYRWGYNSWRSSRGDARTVADGLNVTEKPVRMVRPRD